MSSLRTLLAILKGEAVVLTKKSEHKADVLVGKNVDKRFAINSMVGAVKALMLQLQKKIKEKQEDTKMGLQDLINKYDNGGFSKTGWFQLKDDGDTATVRLLHKGEVGVKDGETDYDFPIYEVHKLDVDGSGRDRTCLCKGESCEFCKSGNKPQLRMFLQMINKDEKDKDKQVQLWERGLTDIKNLIGLAGEYGDLTKRDIKIKRSGAKGSLKTTYQYFPKDPSEMEIPEPQNLVGSLILDLDREDQIKAIEGRLQLNKGNNNDSNNDSGAGATRVF